MSDSDKLLELLGSLLNLDVSVFTIALSSFGPASVQLQRMEILMQLQAISTFLMLHHVESTVS